MTTMKVNGGWNTKTEKSRKSSYQRGEQYMEKPNYVLKFNEGNMVPKNESIVRTILKGIMVFALIILIIGSVLSGSFLFFEMSLSAKICLFMAIGYLIKTGGHVRKPSPCELWFYDDYLILYRPKVYYSKNNIRQEWYKYNYKDIKKCEYRTKVKKINLYGVYMGVIRNYKKDGSLNPEPSYERTVDSICRFYTVFEPKIDFVKEIETHSPIKIEFSES